MTKRKLLKLKSGVLQTITSVNTSTGPVELDQTRVGRLSRIDAMQSQAFARANSQRQDELLQRIEMALKRLESGDYGKCFDCDELIPCARLNRHTLCCLRNRDGIVIFNNYSPQSFSSRRSLPQPLR